MQKIGIGKAETEATRLWKEPYVVLWRDECDFHKGWLSIEEREQGLNEFAVAKFFLGRQ